MAAYNRRWYILASIIAGIGIGLIGASFGVEEFITMKFNATTESDDCKGQAERKMGLFTGSDVVCPITGKVSLQHWPVPCIGKADYCKVLTDNLDKAPRLCECDYGPDKTITPVYSGLHWAIFGVLFVSALIAAYGTAASFYNGITKPTQEVLSVRAVLMSLLLAILFNLVGVILSVVYFFQSYNTDDGCILPEVNLNPEIPSKSQGYTCHDAQLGLAFYFQVIALACFALSIGAAFMGQRGFQSIDETSKIDQTKQKDVGIESSMMF